jgi:fructose/tagatose bisphosphate aldolase
VLLTPIQSRVLFADALAHRYAVLAVNADSPAALTDCLEAAREADAPIIIETSLWQLTGRSFGAGDPLLGMARYLAQLSVLAESERYARVPVVYHTDHIKGPETVRLLTAAICGIPAWFGGAEARLYASTVSLDSSEMTEAENVATVSALCEAATAAGRPLTLEMEAGVDDGLTPPDVTERLLGAVETAHPGNLYLWAPGLGTRHGFSAEGYPAFSPDAVAAQQALATRICGRPVGIALHGSSGLAEESSRAAVAAGVVKVNWSSESLKIRSAAAREYYARHADALEPGNPGFKALAMDNGPQTFIAERYVPAVRERIELLGGAGRGGRLGGELRAVSAS